MRRSTFLFTLLGFAIYLLGTIVGVARFSPQKGFTHTPTLEPINIMVAIDKLEPDHQAVIYYLTSPTINIVWDANLTIYLAKEYLATGQTQHAINLLISAMNSEHSSVEIIRLLADIYHQTEQFDLEQDLLIGAFSTYDETWIKQRLILLNAVIGMPNDDLQGFYSPNDPDDPYAQILHANSLQDPSKFELITANLLRIGESRLAEIVIGAFSWEFGDLPSVKPKLAYIYALHGRVDESRLLLDAVSANGISDLTDADAALISNAYDLIGDRDMALGITEERSATDLKNQTWRRSYLKFLESQNPALALEGYTDMIRQAPNRENLVAMVNLCNNYPAYRDPFGVTAARMLFEAYPSDPSIMLVLARFAISGGEFEKANELLSAWIDKNPHGSYTIEARWLRANALLISETTPSLVAAKDLLEVIHTYPPLPYSESAERLYMDNFH